jgi:basic amino acid/polyamine antiporter, APA family
MVRCIKYFQRFILEQTPWISIVTMMAGSILFVLLGNIVTIANITVFVLVIVYSLVNLSVIILRIREPNLQRPFKIPFNIGKFPILPILGLTSTLFMLTQFGLDVVIVGLITVGVAMLFFVFSRNTTKL